MAKYSDLLKDPRWQKRRLEILQLDLFQCRNCNSKTKTLHVHHLYYMKGLNPWEYSDDALITLCEDCHQRAHDINWQQAFLDLNASPFDLLEIALMLHYKKKKNNELSSEIHKKYKCRLLYFYIVYNLLESSEEVDEYYDFLPSIKEKYNAK